MVLEDSPSDLLNGILLSSTPHCTQANCCLMTFGVKWSIDDRIASVCPVYTWTVVKVLLTDDARIYAL